MKNEISRLTIDIPSKDHKELKVLAIAYKTTMRELFLKAIPYIKQSLKENTDPCKLSKHNPNKKTLKVMKNVKEGKNLSRASTVEELFKLAGIKCSK